MLTALQLGFITGSQFLITLLQNYEGKHVKNLIFSGILNNICRNHCFRVNFYCIAILLSTKKKVRGLMANELSEVSFMFTAQW